MRGRGAGKAHDLIYRIAARQTPGERSMEDITGRERIHDVHHESRHVADLAFKSVVPVTPLLTAGHGDEGSIAAVERRKSDGCPFRIALAG